FTLRPGAAIWDTEHALGEEKERIFIVIPTGPIEDDPNLTDKNFRCAVTTEHLVEDRFPDDKIRIDRQPGGGGGRRRSVCSPTPSLLPALRVYYSFPSVGFRSFLLHEHKVELRNFLIEKKWTAFYYT